MNGVTSDCQSRAKEPVGEKSRWTSGPELENSKFIKDSIAAELSLYSWSFCTLKKDIFHLLDWRI